MSDLDDLSLFAGIVKHGSMSAAGRALNMPKATLSRRLAALERELGTKLIRRSTRAHVLTDAGRRLHARIAPLVVEAERAVAEVRDAAKAPSGLVRLAASAAFGQIVLMPILTRFVREYSKVRLDLTLSDQRVRLVEEGFDLAIRMGVLDDSDLLSRQL